MNSEFIVLAGVSGAPELIRASAIVSVIQDREYTDRRIIEYVAGDKLLTLFAKDTTTGILQMLGGARTWVEEAQSDVKSEE